MEECSEGEREALEREGDGSNMTLCVAERLGLGGGRRAPSSRGDSDRSDEEDEDVEVDVEECSEGERKALKRTAAECVSEDEDRDSPGPKVKRRCNWQELLSADCHLETKELWDKFHDLGTEMIITKTGRLVHNSPYYLYSIRI